MSYGRKPYYIYRTDHEIIFCGIETLGGDDSIAIPYDAMAQYISSLAARGDIEINELIERGKLLRPKAFPKLSITVNNPGFVAG